MEDKDNWFKYSDHVPLLYPSPPNAEEGHIGKIFTGLTKTQLSKHFIQKADYRGMPFFPISLRGRMNTTLEIIAKAANFDKSDPTSRLIARKLSEIPHRKFSDFPWSETNEHGCKTILDIVWERHHKPQSILNARKLVSKDILNKIDAHEPLTPDEKDKVEWAFESSERWALHEFLLNCHHEFFNFAMMPIEKFSTCKYLLDENGVPIPLMRENKNGVLRPVPSNDPRDMVHKVTFLGCHNGIWFTMGVDVIPKANGLAGVNDKLKHVKNNEKLFVAKSESYKDDPHYLIDIAGHRVPMHREYDMERYWEGFDRKRSELITEFNDLYGLQLLGEGHGSGLPSFLQSQLDDYLEDWKRDNRESYQIEEVHTYGYEATTIINESYVEIEGQPFSTWPKKRTDKRDDKCNNNNGYPNKVANILEYHNPRNLPLDLKKKQAIIKT